MECPFCPERLEKEQHAVLENEHCLFLQPQHRVLVGSGFIIPREHRETVFDLTPQEWAATQTLLLVVKAAVDKRFKPDGYNVGWNNGTVGGQTVMHVHMHVIPRFAGEPFAGRGIRWWLKSEDNLIVD